MIHCKHSALQADAKASTAQKRLGMIGAAVGIRAIELYVPRVAVEQSALEHYDGAATNKYTVGLGQQQMSVCTDLEDVHSICLTVARRLLTRYNVDLGTIGRVECGTESAVDKSKSVKSVLMRLFEDSGHTDMAGADCINACYGGTQALFNAVDWCQGSEGQGSTKISFKLLPLIPLSWVSRPTGAGGDGRHCRLRAGPGALYGRRRRCSATCWR